MDDSLYVNDGATYQPQDYQAREPEQQAIDRQEEREKLLASYPIIQDVIQWFEGEIEQATKTDNIQFDLVTINGVTIDRKVSIEAQVFASYLLKQRLEAKFSEFKELKAND